MDEQVLKAMQRWPDVPDAYGWLRLDARGRWCLVDRNAPGFDPVRDAAGSPIGNRQILDFIGRNYQSDALGRWYWQNGPQRCFATLERAPLMLRLVDAGGHGAAATVAEAAGAMTAAEAAEATTAAAAEATASPAPPAVKAPPTAASPAPPLRRLVTQDGWAVTHVRRALLDAEGHLYVVTDLGPAALDDRDLARLELSEDAGGALLWHDAPGSDGALRVETVDDGGGPAAGAAAGAADAGSAGAAGTADVIARLLGFVRDPKPEAEPSAPDPRCPR